MRQDEEEYNSFVDPEELKEVITPKKPRIFESDTSQPSSTCDTNSNPEVVRKEIKKPLFDRPEIWKSRNFLPPIKEAITAVILDQIIPVDIDGQWDLQKRQPTFILRNRDSIVTIFEENFI